MAASNYPYLTLIGAEKWWIEKSRRNPLMFVEYMSEKRPGPHNKAWFQSILTQDLTNIIAPRGSAKTTALVYLMAWLMGREPLKTYGLWSVTGQQAEDRLSMMTSIIESPRYANIFPHIAIDRKKPCTKTQFSLMDTSIPYATWQQRILTVGEAKNPTMFAAGIGSSQTIGRRITGLAGIDDPYSEETAATREQRAKVVRWTLNTLMNTRVAGSRMALISTRWAEDDLSGVFKESKRSDGSPIWNTLETKAIQDDGTSYWPEVWPLEALDEKRAEVGETIFRLAYLNDVYGLSSNQFTLDNVRQPLPKELPPFKTLAISTDFAFTEGTRSDYTVLALVARDHDRDYKYFVLDYWIGKTNVESAKLQLYRMADQWFEQYGPIDHIYYENATATEVMVSSMRADRPDLRFTPVPLRGQDKVARANPLAGKAQREKFFLNTQHPAYQQLLNQFLGFPGAQHDDFVDALDLPFQIWGAGASRASTVRIQSPYLL